MALFIDRVSGACMGGAIGDAMGAPVEGKSPQFIAKSIGTWDFNQFIPPLNWDGQSQLGKGNGHITDDTLMTEAFMRAYLKCGAHIDAYGYEKWLMPEITQTIVWLPERQRDMPIFERLWFPEKYPYLRLCHTHADPRSAGVGNTVNCGIAMWMMPAGAVNAGDPEGAYQEAAAIGLAHNESFAIEAGATMAAACATAMSAGATIGAVCDAAQTFSRDGTHNAIVACVRAVDGGDPLPVFIEKVRTAVTPFDQRSGHTPDDQPLNAEGVSDSGRPSRLASIEELPVALAALKYGDGDFLKTLAAGVCYGRDCDSIAGMACSLWGAIYGVEAIPHKLCRDVERANRRDFIAQARPFAELCLEVHKADQRRWAARTAALGRA